MNCHPGLVYEPAKDEGEAVQYTGYEETDGGQELQQVQAKGYELGQDHHVDYYVIIFTVTLILQFKHFELSLKLIL